jgi:indolepyruvate ferredoxin oxidoreductase, beta subunit
MSGTTKILVAGVGGQGVVFLTNLLVKAAMLADVPVATSEIHGLAQRGGSVTAGITLGENSYGFLEAGGVDILFGLEPLEAQRCVSYLNKNSIAVIDENRILPYSVNSGSTAYPNVKMFVDYLKTNIKNVVYNEESPKGINSIQRNLYVLGKACKLIDFPIETEFIEKAISEIVIKGREEKCLEAFAIGLDEEEIIVESK